MMSKLSYFLLSFILIPVLSFSQAFREFSDKTVFNNQYPYYLTFRGEMISANHKTYDAWKAAFTGTTGVIRKFVLEEYPELKAPKDVVNWANTYAKFTPDMLMLLHYNTQYRTVEDKPDVFEKYFPGHWVLNQGSSLTSSISSQSTTISCDVVNTSLFSMDEYRDAANGHLPAYLLIVPFDTKGEKLWYESEYVRLENVNVVTKQLTVKRGQLYSTAKNFPAGSYVAAIPGIVISQHPMFCYNMSSLCPKDNNGKQALDVFVDELCEYLDSEDGLLKNFNGIAFDTNAFDVTNNPKFDVDNDGIGDGGIVDGFNVWRKGVWTMFRNLRNSLGNNYIITADGQRMQNQQSVGVLNGIESEGLVQGVDGWRGISRTLNTHLYWRQFSDVDPYFSYVVLKFSDTNDSKPENIGRLTRFSIASAVCLEAHVAKYPDDITVLPAWVREPGSLGKIQGPVVRLSQFSDEILNLSDATLSTELKSAHGTFSVTDNGVLFTPYSSTNFSQAIWTLNNINVPAGDLTLFLEAKAVDPLEGFSQDDAVPRHCYALLSGLPDYGEGSTAQRLATDIYGFFGTKGFSDMSYYYRRPGVKAGNQNITFSVQGSGKVLLKNIRLYNQSDVFGRQFENGMVIVNPSFDSVTINPLSYFPNSGVTETSITIPPVDAVFLQGNGILGNSIISDENIQQRNTFKISGGTHHFRINTQNAQINIRDIMGKTIETIQVNEPDFQISLPKNQIYIVQLIDG